MSTVWPVPIDAAQANKETPILEMFVALTWASLFGYSQAGTSGLTFGVQGGQMLVDGVLTTVAAQSTLLPASSTSYVEATRAGVISDNTTGFTAGRIPLWIVPTTGSGVDLTGLVDCRAWHDLPGVAGRVSVAVTSADVTLSAAQARCEILNITGTLTGNRSVIVPDGPQSWCVTNNTSGAFTLTVKTAAGTGIAITQGKAADLIADGTNVVLSNNDSAAIGGALLVANNLSDVASAATARTNLGVDSAINNAIAAIGLSGFRYKIERANTTASDPTAGLMKFNNATEASVTEIYLDDSTFDSVDLSTLLGSLGTSGLVKITSVADVGEWRVYKWTAAPTDNTGWWTFTVVDQAGTGTFEDDDEVQVIFLQLSATSGAVVASAVGITDAGGYFTGTDVEAALQELGASMAAAGKVPAQRYTIELANTTDSDPGAGLIKFNNGTPASATELYIDDSTSDSVDLSTLFASFGATGFIKIQSVADAGEWAIFKWTAAPTDQTGYFKFVVTPQASKGTLDDADAVLIEFDSDANTGSGGTELKGITFTSDTGSTADSDPGAGLFKWDNATQGSATKLFFDNSTLDSIAITTFFATLSTDGTVYIQQGDDATKWQLWEIDSATADSGYYDMAVTLLAKSTADIDDAKTCYCTFTKGAAAAGGGTKTYAVLTPMTSQPPASNFATLDTRNSIAVLDFDDSTEESTFWVFVMPEAASLGSGLKIRIHWAATSATSGDARWGAHIERMNTDMDADSFDTAAEVTTAANGTSGIAQPTEITLTTIDSVAAGELLRLKVYRDTTGADTITGDIEIVAVEVRSAA
jgi:hypothetical protein